MITSPYIKDIALSDFFAAQAMQGFISRAEPDVTLNLNECAKLSYGMAEAMLTIREELINENT